MKEKKIHKSFKRFLQNWWFSIVLLIIVILLNIKSDKLDAYLNFDKNTKIDISELVRKIENKEVNSLSVSGDVIIASKSDKVNEKDNGNYEIKKESGVGIIDVLSKYGVDKDRLQALSISINNEENYLRYFLVYLLPIVIFFALFIFLLKGIKGINSKALSFGNSKARRIDPNNKKDKVTFQDVAGTKVAKQELQEIVEFLKEPKKFIDIGATIPRGVLLTGAPGTGKTLLARAVAGEANVPFFHLSGSEFVEMFVGVGASRVRDLFSEAKASAPAIIFIDEIDSIGRSRGIGLGGGNDEREQTLNQILVEMDGFEPNEKVIVMAATNRSDVLDSALLRPGRFDRRINIDLPDRKEREEILIVHSKKKLLEDNINYDLIATRTPGFSGAELQSLMNESAILAARENKLKISEEHILKNIEKVMLGPERKNHLADEKEKILVAYHEAGHALVASLLPNADPVHKISIISRGYAGGYTLKLPDNERRLNNKNVFIDDIAMTFGGYAAEELIYGVITTGPSGDIQQATELARAMVTKYGMSDIVGPIAVESDKNTLLFGKARGDKEFSDNLSEKIDIEIKRILEEGRETARRIVREYKHVLEAIKDKLIEKENLEREEFEEILESFGIKIKKEKVIS